MSGNLENARVQSETLATMKDASTKSASGTIERRHRALIRYLTAAYYGVRSSPTKR